MKKYLESYEDLYDWITGLEVDKKEALYVENEEESNEYVFQKMSFMDEEIILYESCYGGIGILQDCCGIYTLDDLISGLWEDYVEDEDNKVFIKTE